MMQMTLKEFLFEIDQILEYEPGTVALHDILAELEAWDSLAILSFIAMIDETFQLQVPGREIAKCKSVLDLVELVGTKILR